MMMKRGGWGFLTDEKAIAVYSALIATPFVLRMVTPYVGSGQNTWIILAVVGFIVILIAKRLMGKIKAAVFGIGAAILLNAFLTIPQLQRYTSRLVA